MWNSALRSAIFFRVRIALKKFTQVLSYVVCTQVRRHAHKKITKKRYGVEKPGRFFFRKTNFVYSRSRTYYALRLGYFGLRFLPDIRHWVYWVLDGIWALDSSQKIGNKFLFITARAERKDRLCVKLFDFFPTWILIRLNWNLSCFITNLVQVPKWNFKKKLFWENFSEILCKPRLSSTETCEILPFFLQFFFRVRIALKKFTQVLSYVVCTQVRRHVHKKITKKRYGVEKPGRLFFSENQLCLLSV